MIISSSEQIGVLFIGTVARANQNDTAMTKFHGVCGDIDELSNRVESTIVVINEIAFQTNFFALSAFVEAAGGVRLEEGLLLSRVMFEA